MPIFSETIPALTCPPRARTLQTAERSDAVRRAIRPAWPEDTSRPRLSLRNTKKLSQAQIGQILNCSVKALSKPASTAPAKQFAVPSWARFSGGSPR